MRLLTPRGFRRIAAENMMLRQQLIFLSRQKKRARRLKLAERFLFGLFASMLNQHRLARLAIALKPATLLKFHKALVNRKYSLLFSNKTCKKPGPKGPDQSIIDLILDLYQLPQAA